MSESVRQIPSVNHTAQASNPTMTVEVAQKFFQDYGDDTQGLYEELYKTLLGKGAAELANDNYLDALQLSALMIRKTNTSFRMLTGHTAEAFIGHLRGYFAEMIERLHAAGKCARLIVLNADVPSPFLSDLVSRYGNTLQVQHATTPSEETVAHFIVADDMVRIEKTHPRLAASTPASVIQARVLFNNRGAASFYEEEFDRLFSMLRPTRAKK